MSRYGGCLLGALLVAGGAVTGAGEPAVLASAMPGAPHTGPLPPLAEGERELATRLEADVRTLRFVFFANEEPPWFQTDDMGSLRYARGCRRRGERIMAMLSLETLGYYTDAPGTQRFDSLPPLRLLYPDTGNFVAFVADVGSADLVRRVVGTFRRTTRFPAYGCALPGAIRGVGWSDHWSFWQAGYPGVMVTDTAVFRYPHYHAPEDTPDKLDYDRLARVVAGLGRVVDDLVAGGEAAPQPVGEPPPAAAED